MAESNRRWRKAYDMREWEWWKYPKMVKMLYFLITNVTYRRERLTSGNIISRGEMETTLSELMLILDMTKKEVRISIERMKRTNNIHTRAAHKHLIITLLNYDKYQGKATKAQYNTAVQSSNDPISDSQGHGDNTIKTSPLGHGVSTKKGTVISKKGHGTKTSENSINKGVSADNDNTSSVSSGHGVNSTIRARSYNNGKSRGTISAKMGHGCNGDNKLSRNSDKQGVCSDIENGKNAPEMIEKGTVSAKMGHGWGTVDKTLIIDENTDKQTVSDISNDSDKIELGHGNEQKTGKKNPYIEYNRIIEGINISINTSKIFSKSLDSTEKAEFVSSFLKSIGMDEPQEVENGKQSPTQLFDEEQGHDAGQDEMKLKKKKPTKQRPPKEDVTLTSKCRRIFEPFYKGHVGEEYYWEAKDGGSMKYLIQKIKKARSDRGQPTDDEDIVTAWSALLDSISDQWMLEHMSIVNINSKYNEIVASAKRDRTNGTGQRETPTSTGEDKYERKQRIIAERQRKLMASADAEEEMFTRYRKLVHDGEISSSVSFDDWLRGDMAEESVS